MTRLLRRLLYRADRPRGTVVSRDEVLRWPQPHFLDLLELGFLVEGPQESALYLWECDDPDWAEPAWVRHAATGKMIGLVRCERCGVAHTIDPDRMRTWRLDIVAVCRFVQSAVGQLGPILEEVAERVWTLGTTPDGVEDIFLLRGANWLDSEKILATVPRFRVAKSPLVLTLGLPPGQRLSENARTMALPELIRWDGPKPTMQLPPLAPPTIPGEPLRVLLDAEIDVLSVLAESPNRSLLLEDIVAACGHSRGTTRKSLQRLEEGKLIARPAGKRRKGFNITMAGRTVARELKSP